MDFKLRFPLKAVNVDSYPIKHTQILVKKTPTTPHDFYCQTWIIAKLLSLGFKIKRQNINGVLNTINALKRSKYHFSFYGHTDDEEGYSDFGTKEVVNTLSKQGIKFSAALVGEPTSDKFIGDTIKIGRRDAISFNLTAFGKSDPTIHPERAKNATHVVQRIMSVLLSIDLNPQDNFSGHTSLQATHLNSGDFVGNIFSAQCGINFNIQYSNHFSESPLTVLINKAIAAVTTDYNLTSHCDCAPYFSNPIAIPTLQGIAYNISQTVNKIHFLDYGRHLMAALLPTTYSVYFLIIFKNNTNK
jgi:acetylornithine deacetylase/succinyl-diaminopimelate desuccinylase-like protein